jgi:hypothetical protein
VGASGLGVLESVVGLERQDEAGQSNGVADLHACRRVGRLAMWSHQVQSPRGLN